MENYGVWVRSLVGQQLKELDEIDETPIIELLANEEVTSEEYEPVLMHSRMEEETAPRAEMRSIGWSSILRYAAIIVVILLPTYFIYKANWGEVTDQPQIAQNEEQQTPDDPKNTQGLLIESVDLPQQSTSLFSSVVKSADSYGFASSEEEVMIEFINHDEQLSYLKGLLKDVPEGKEDESTMRVEHMIDSLASCENTYKLIVGEPNKLVLYSNWRKDDLQIMDASCVWSDEEQTEIKYILKKGEKFYLIQETQKGNLKAFSAELKMDCME